MPEGVGGFVAPQPVKKNRDKASQAEQFEIESSLFSHLDIPNIATLL